MKQDTVTGNYNLFSVQMVVVYFIYTANMNSGINLCFPIWTEAVN